MEYSAMLDSMFVAVQLLENRKPPFLLYEVR